MSIFEDKFEPTLCEYCQDPINTHELQIKIQNTDKSLHVICCMELYYTMEDLEVISVEELDYDIHAQKCLR